VRLLKELDPQLEIETIIVKTSGDKDRRPFAAIGGKGLFTTEVEQAVVRKEADIAVHSAKDLTTEIAAGCDIRIVERGPVHDVVVGGTGTTGYERLTRLASGATVGTSSMRRRSQLAALRPDLTPVELRGNVDTRVSRVNDGEVGVAILAAAGLVRAGLLPDGGELDPTRWIPAPAQGAIAVEFVSEGGEMRDLVHRITDESADAEVTCERAFSERLEGGCSIPLGCLAVARGELLRVFGYLGDTDGSGVTKIVSGPIAQGDAIGAALADEILASGGAQIQESIRAAMA
jgi:hydroxymethylbilane synthase